ncbi:hypothetical protein GPECTOR_12g516 [Gonium pectorale]|uniref:Thaumatin-like protein n=1 Tax=Gonium pectorale TaxID=33097 RepID=A0A150GNY8_GONPE|nr:hypothetical protein GPECTOR_12g516 [Gonium pectorale]|eukprot:KXZ51553.1 hypothetical protein GPECTOR_12g516 [Gonium pectorale]
MVMYDNPQGQRALLPQSLASFLAALLLLLSAAPRGAHSYVLLRNSCPFAVTAYSRSGAGATSTHGLAAFGGQKTLTFSSNVWTAGVIWASRTGNTNTGQSTQIEFNLGVNMGNGHRQDFYDVSVINAHNLNVRVRPINPPRVSGLWCGSPTCRISSLPSFCQSPNYLLGTDPACINAHGPGQAVTAGTQAFKNACPTAYSYSKDDRTSVFSCQWGTDYEVRFCP